MRHRRSRVYVLLWDGPWAGRVEELPYAPAGLCVSGELYDRAGVANGVHVYLARR